MSDYCMEPTIEEAPHDLPRGDGYEALPPRLLVGPSGTFFLLIQHKRGTPYFGMHPRAVDGFPSASLAIEWWTRFTDWLTTWTENVLPTVDFVRAHRRHMDDIVEPIMVMRDFWGRRLSPWTVILSGVMYRLPLRIFC
ncbi:hypothetical protein R1sor_015391 [Riccia sorocarpa]|uniref:Uncharacterized protein n=1 Tax=Riccia sorocarpa TaxID=122646 RepID=A0ABD3HF39_9MARC